MRSSEEMIDEYVFLSYWVAVLFQITLVIWAFFITLSPETESICKFLLAFVSSDAWGPKI